MEFVAIVTSMPGGSASATIRFVLPLSMKTKLPGSISDATAVANARFCGSASLARDAIGVDPSASGSAPP